MNILERLEQAERDDRPIYLTRIEVADLMEEISERLLAFELELIMAHKVIDTLSGNAKPVPVN